MTNERNTAPMKTRLGIGTYSFAWAVGVPGYPAPQMPMDGFRLLNRALELGVSVLQIADNLPLHLLSPEVVARLCDEAAQHGISIEVGTRGIQPDHLKKYLKIAQQCGSPILRVVVDTVDHHPTPDEIVGLVQGVLPLFEQSGIALAIENHDRFKTATLAHILQQIDSPYVGICLDTVNSFGALEGPEVVMETLGRYVVNLHVKDFTIRRADHNLGFVVTGTPAGKGMLNTPALLEHLNSLRREFNAILELWTPPEANIEATIVKEADWVVESLTYLRTLIEG